jgi:histidinol-phosphate aminotransferase
MNGVTPAAVPLLADFQLDVDRILQSRARALYLCSPNNPTGTALRRDDVLSLLENFDGLILLDEAYADFGFGNFLDDVLRSSNAVIIRTLSKAWGLAGLRLGIAAGPPDLIADIEKSRGPYKVSKAAEHAATAALRQGRDWVDHVVAQVRSNRSRLVIRLEEIGQRVIPSEANFVLLPISGGASAVQIARELRVLGVGVRPFPALAGLGDCIRVTVGPWPVMEAFLAAHAAVLQDLRRTSEA